MATDDSSNIKYYSPSIAQAYKRELGTMFVEPSLYDIMNDFVPQDFVTINLFGNSLKIPCTSFQDCETALANLFRIHNLIIRLENVANTRVRRPFWYEKVSAPMIETISLDECQDEKQLSLLGDFIHLMVDVRKTTPRYIGIRLVIDSLFDKFVKVNNLTEKQADSFRTLCLCFGFGIHNIQLQNATYYYHNNA